MSNCGSKFWGSTHMSIHVYPRWYTLGPFPLCPLWYLATNITAKPTTVEKGHIILLWRLRARNKHWKNNSFGHRCVLAVCVTGMRNHRLQCTKMHSFCGHFTKQFSKVIVSSNYPGHCSTSYATVCFPVVFWQVSSDSFCISLMAYRSEYHYILLAIFIYCFLKCKFNSLFYF